MGKPIYLDYNATTPVDTRVLEKMLPFFTENFGNAASADHAYGWEAKEAVDHARQQVAQLINARAAEITFTSGSTEAINLTLKGVPEANLPAGHTGHIITQKTEHKAVLDTCQYLERNGCRITYLDVDQDGNISLEELEKAITGQTILVSIQYANNETGVIHRVKEIGVIARQHGVYFFCDATQAVGKIPVDVVNDHIDLLAFSGHKIYGPKGVGVLYTRSQSPIKIAIQQHGGNHERGKRSGTLNTPAIAGIGEAAALCKKEMQTDGDRLKKLRDHLENGLILNIPGTKINGGKANRLPQVSNLLFPEVNGEQLLLILSNQLALSRGSACSSAQRIPSYVIQAMGLGEAAAHDSIRFSLGRFTTESEIEKVIEIVTGAVIK